MRRNLAAGGGPPPPRGLQVPLCAPVRLVARLLGLLSANCLAISRYLDPHLRPGGRGHFPAACPGLSPPNFPGRAAPPLVVVKPACLSRGLQRALLPFARLRIEFLLSPPPPRLVSRTAAPRCASFWTSRLWSSRSRNYSGEGAPRFRVFPDKLGGVLMALRCGPPFAVGHKARGPAALWPCPPEPSSPGVPGPAHLRIRPAGCLASLRSERARRLPVPGLETVQLA